MDNYRISQEGDDIVVSFDNCEALIPVRTAQLNNFFDAGFSHAPYNGYYQNGWINELAISLAAGTNWDTACDWVMNDSFTKVDMTIGDVKVQAKSSLKQKDYEEYHPNIRNSMTKGTLEKNDLVVWSFCRNAKKLVHPRRNAADGKPVYYPARIDPTQPLEAVIREGVWTSKVDINDVPVVRTGTTHSHYFEGMSVPAAQLSIFSGVVA